MANEPSAERLLIPRGTERTFSIKTLHSGEFREGSIGQVGMSFRQLKEKTREEKTLSFVTQMDEGGRGEVCSRVVNDLTAGLKASPSIKGSRAS